MTYQAIVNDATCVLNAMTAPAAIKAMHYGAVYKAGQVRHTTAIKWIEECLRPINDLLAAPLLEAPIDQYRGASYELHRKLGLINRGDMAGHTVAVDLDDADEVLSSRNGFGACSYDGFIEALMVILADRGVELSDDNPYRVDLYEAIERIYTPPVEDEAEAESVTKPEADVRNVLQRIAELHKEIGELYDSISK